MHEHDISGLWCGLRSGGTREKRTCRSGSRHADERAAIHQIAVPKFTRVVHQGSPLPGMWFWPFGMSISATRCGEARSLVKVIRRGGSRRFGIVALWTILRRSKQAIKNL
jgi:hypothetical protein